MDYLEVRNWDKFQHYKHRNPPWIKLHNDMLRNYEYLCLQDASKLLLTHLWMLASLMDNKIPNDKQYLKSQTGIKGSVDCKELISKGFIMLLADCKQDASKLHTNAITETEKRQSKSRDREETELDHFSDQFHFFWSHYPRKVAKLAASKVFNKLSTADQQLAADKIEGFTFSTDTKFIPHASTWLNQKRWLDEPEPENKLSQYSENQQKSLRAISNVLKKQEQKGHEPK